MRIAFRVDAALAIGTGHVMRCLTLAHELSELGANCMFVCRQHEGHLAQLIEQRGFLCHLLALSETPYLPQSDDLAHAAWLGATWQQDAQQTLALFAEPVDWLVVDHYAIDARWQALVKAGYQRLLVIDDLADREHLADVLLDQTYGRQVADYQSLVPQHCQLLLGSTYALLRPEFAQWRETSLSRRTDQMPLQNILISMGGVDAQNHTSQILVAINSLNLPKPLHLTVVLGSNAPHLQQVQVLASTLNYPTRVLTSVDNMAELMVNADLAIGAAGSTTWERACLGLPSLLFCLADNQRTSVESVSNQGAAWFMRDMKQLGYALNLLTTMPERLAQMQRLASELTQGLGAVKVAQKLQQKPLTLIPVSLEDSQTLFEWRNHPSIRSVSLHQEVLQFEAHQQWVASSLVNPNRVMWMAYCGDSKIGMIRFDRSHELSREAEVSLYLAPNQQGKGLGKQLLTAGEQAIVRQWSNIERIKAQVLATNQASVNLFTHAQYQANLVSFQKQVSYEPFYSH
ncbi:MAG TPA: UDP-2,4-diacetamido-2,4,6-trideoxy-beta-L-altropyranose hydrolase [Thiotrichales bacterium]|nr:MAG: UDP-2,4-diacetamido-2,4,6-trideoxy-beta-L-altropyranose hydrolase [Thiotrichales bacterium 35-46-9]HQR95385.1 UDP-2,4-diacetamido-2,4,6-trideoxy-beta-L-altropyranose hydrolase [Thiotrichales bacterium]